MRTELLKLKDVWRAMVKRCTDSKDNAYARYGGRGITVSEEWMTFSNFLADMSPRPEGLTLERIDNSKGYSRENCKWATRYEQGSNKRNCIYVMLDGERLALKEACRRVGLKYRAVHKRIMNRGWPVEVALSKPVGTGRIKCKS